MDLLLNKECLPICQFLPDGGQNFQLGRAHLARLFPTQPAGDVTQDNGGNAGDENPVQPPAGRSSGLGWQNYRQPAKLCPF